jgi:hypothetical protein
MQLWIKVEILELCLDYENQLKLANRKIKNVGTCTITAIVHKDKVYVAKARGSQGISIF